MLRSGRSAREVARHFGFDHTTVARWNKKVPADFCRYRVIRTESSKPRSHPAALPKETVWAVLELRRETGRGAEYIHHLLTAKRGLELSLSSVKRTIQEECIARLPFDLSVWNRELPQYLHHYNHERPHMGLDWKTPMEMLQNQP